jgi:hypothetical protein
MPRKTRRAISTTIPGNSGATHAAEAYRGPQVGRQEGGHAGARRGFWPATGVFRADDPVDEADREVEPSGPSGLRRGAGAEAFTSTSGRPPSSQWRTSATVRSLASSGRGVIRDVVVAVSTKSLWQSVPGIDSPSG